MPKLTKKCNNSFRIHDECSYGIDGSRRIVNLKAFGLGELAEVFAKFLAHEKNYPHLKKLATFAKVVFSNAKKRKFSRHLSKLSPDTIEKKVSNNLIG